MKERAGEDGLSPNVQGSYACLTASLKADGEFGLNPESFNP